MEEITSPAEKTRTTMAFWVAYALAVLIPWQIYFPVYGSLDASLVSLLELVLFGLLLGNLINFFRSGLKGSLMDQPATFFWVIMLISILFAEKGGSAFKYGVKWSSYLFLFYLFRLLPLTRELRKKIIFVIIAGGVLLALAAQVQFFVGVKSLKFIAQNKLMSLFIEPGTWKASGNFRSQQIMNGQVRPAVVFADVISFTAYLGLIFPFCLGFSIFGEKKWRILAQIASLLIAAAVLLTRTRSAYLAMTAVVFVLGIWGIKLRCGSKTSSRLAVTAVLLLIAAFFVFRSSRTVQHLEQGFARRGSSATHRIDCWQRALEVTERYPILGIGLANQGGRKDEMIHTATPPHSNYYLISAEYGLLGLTAFFWLMISCVQAAAVINHDEQLRPLAFGLAGLVTWLMVQSFFGHYFTNDKFSMLLWTLLGLLASVEAQSKTEAKSKDWVYLKASP